jgi:hypothetical protein
MRSAEACVQPAGVLISKPAHSIVLAIVITGTRRLIVVDGVCDLQSLSRNDHGLKTLAREHVPELSLHERQPTRTSYSTPHSRHHVKQRLQTKRS